MGRIHNELIRLTGRRGRGLAAAVLLLGALLIAACGAALTGGTPAVPAATARATTSEFSSAAGKPARKATVTPTRTRRATVSVTRTRRPTRQPTVTRSAGKTPTVRPTRTARATRTPQATATPQNADGLLTIRHEELPAEARKTIQLIDQGGPFPFRRDGIVFQNRERILPPKPNGYYHEYTVETPGEADRGARRIVTGAEGQLYYSDDHYASFRRVIR